MNCKTARIVIETASNESVVSIFTPSTIVKVKREDIEYVGEWEDRLTINIYMQGGNKEYFIDAESIQAIKIFNN